MTNQHLSNTVIIATIADLVATTIHGVAGDEIAQHIGSVDTSNITDISISRMQQLFSA